MLVLPATQNDGTATGCEARSSGTDSRQWAADPARQGLGGDDNKNEQTGRRGMEVEGEGEPRRCNGSRRKARICREAGPGAGSSFLMAERENPVQNRAGREIEWRR